MGLRPRDARETRKLIPQPNGEAMRKRAIPLGLLLTVALAATVPARAATAPPPNELIRIDANGVMKWGTSEYEVAMLGANYCLPSASDYRAAGAVHADRKRLIDQDMAHFDRMGWDALRLSFWGDWECCDRDGNLIANDHLDLLDYLIYRAKQRDLHMMLSPIVTYSSSWPGPDDPAAVGFSRYYTKEELGTNPKAIAAQANYLKQLLNHVSPYTKLALKDEPYICYLELINEPAQHPQDFQGSVDYINALVAAVRGTGCRKITFFNASQDFGMAQAIAASNVDGSSFAWYPSGLVSGHQLRGNFLRTVDDYSPMLERDLLGKPKAVYEYDMPDVMSGYHYPAMVRTFRSVGAQFAAMFSYDMLATAPYNLGWQTHCLNMVYTPQKAASAIIASQVMRRIPRMQPVGPYPANTRFGDFHVSYEDNLSELVSRDLFYYSNDTASRPPAPAELRRVVGFGSSPVVRYDGVGLYFLDKLEDGVWHLEVYPDSIQIDDPFAPTRADRLVFQLIARAWPMSIALPDLGESFRVEPLNDGNTYSTTAAGGTFGIRPGAYLLTASSRTAPFALPDRLPNLPYVYGTREFVCPETSSAPPCVVLHAQSDYAADGPIAIRATVASSDEPSGVTLVVASPNRPDKAIPMEQGRGYDYTATLAPGSLPEGTFSFQVRVTVAGTTLAFPHDSPVAAGRSESYRARVVAPDAPVTLFDPARDIASLAVSRGGVPRNRGAPQTPGSEPGSVAYPLRLSTEKMPEDFTASLYIGDRVSERARTLPGARSIHIRLKAVAAPSVIRLTLVEKDGSAWSEKVFATTQWTEVVVPIASLRSARSVMLPQGYPGNWSYWLSPPTSKAGIDLTQVERLQFSLRKADFENNDSVPASQSAVAIEAVSLQY
jgi:hypothetical protein